MSEPVPSGRNAAGPTSATGDSGPTTADFWFDPVCPFTWRASRWLVDIASNRNLTPSWHVMSLSVLHEGTVSPASGQGPLVEAAAALRVLAAAEEHGGQQALAKLYTVLGSRKHDRGEPYTPENIRHAVLDAGLPEAIADAATDSSYDDRIAASHQQGQERGGTEMGSPVLALDDSRGYFGPVITAIPTGEEAVRLFDAIRLLASVPAFSEIKTSRS
jgi:2-hydroxychromene-2-carboxylate isomerase